MGAAVTGKMWPCETDLLQRVNNVDDEEEHCSGYYVCTSLSSIRSASSITLYQWIYGYFVILYIVIVISHAAFSALTRYFSHQFQTRLSYNLFFNLLFLPPPTHLYSLTLRALPASLSLTVRWRGEWQWQFPLGLMRHGRSGRKTGWQVNMLWPGGLA